METTRTLYVQNLNEKVELGSLAAELQKAFDGFGASVQDVVVKGRLSMRGQAFVVCGSREAASRAIFLADGFRIFGRAMIVRFARRDSDCVLRAEGTYEQEYLRRAQEKLERSRLPPRLTRRQMMEQMSPSGAPVPKIASSSSQAPSLSVTVNAAGKPVMAPQVVGGELQLPSKVLYLQNVPAEAGEEQITDFFRPDHVIGLVEVRVVPTRKDLAFVEFSDEAHASAARQALDGASLLGAPVKVSFAKR